VSDLKKDLLSMMISREWVAQTDIIRVKGYSLFQLLSIGGVVSIALIVAKKGRPLDYMDIHVLASHFGLSYTLITRRKEWQNNGYY
jgi:hypothetical protein